MFSAVWIVAVRGSLQSSEPPLLNCVSWWRECRIASRKVHQANLLEQVLYVPLDAGLFIWCPFIWKVPLCSEVFSAWEAPFVLHLVRTCEVSLESS